MARKVLSVSVSEEENQIIEELQLSPSALIQASVQLAKENSRFSRETAMEIQRQRDKWKENWEKATNFIKSKDLWNEYVDLIAN